MRQAQTDGDEPEGVLELTKSGGNVELDGNLGLYYA